MIAKTYRIFVIGAGFSRGAGLPLGNELFCEVRKRANIQFGSDNWLSEDLAEFIEYKRRCEGTSLSEEDVNFEEFLSFLDIEHFLGLRGKDTWSQEGNEAQVLVKRLIGKIIYDRTPSDITKLPKPYFRFVELLNPKDIIITFNYDTISERCLDHIGKPYRLFPVDTSKEEVIILKMHGSIDWFDRSDYEKSEKFYKSQVYNMKPQDPIFEDPQKYLVTPIVAGPQNPENPLCSMFRIRKVDHFYSSPYPPATPWILSPSYSKIVYSTILQDFWYGMGNIGSWNFGAGIVGFSLPPHDEYVKQVIYRLVVNYQETEQEVLPLGLKKGNFKMIDFCPDHGSLIDLKNRYRFVDWNRTDLYVKGFNDESVEMLFR